VRTFSAAGAGSRNRSTTKAAILTISKAEEGLRGGVVMEGEGGEVKDGKERREEGEAEYYTV